MPHGLIGLLIAVMIAAALGSKASELNALGTTSTIDLWRHLRPLAAHDEARNVRNAKWFTAFWGVFAIGFALYVSFAENLAEAINILGSLFYGVPLGLFLVAFFLKRVGGTAVFWAAVIGQALVLVLYSTLTISYLWYNLIGCASCMLFSIILQSVLRTETRTAE
jgi:Na+/proline symporter